MSGQVEIISQASTYSDFQIIVIVVHSMPGILQGTGTGPTDPRTARPKFAVAISREPTINNKREMRDYMQLMKKYVFCSYHGIKFQNGCHS